MLSRHADPADAATEVAELHLQKALANKKPEAPKEGGTCLYCGESIEPERRWCDAECARLWEREDELARLR